MTALPIDRQSAWDAAAQLVSEDNSKPEYDRAISELIGELFGWTQDEYPAVLEALRFRQQQQRALWRTNLPVDPTTGGQR